MSRATVLTETGPSLEGFLHRIAGSKVLILSTQAGSRTAAAVESLLKNREGNGLSGGTVTRIEGRSDGLGQAGARVSVPEETLAWIEAGDLFESLLAAVEAGGRFQTVLCVDPWAAMTLTRRGNPCPDASWVFVTDLEARADPNGSSYWRDTAGWIKRLPFNLVVAADSLSTSTGRASSEVSPKRTAEPHGRALAWRWVQPGLRKRKDAEVPPASITVLFRQPRSILKLRTALDALARQNDRTRPIRIRILGGESHVELGDCLKAFSIAHPSLGLEVVPRPREDEAGKAGLARAVFLDADSERVVLADEAVLFPPDLSSLLAAGTGSTGFWTLERVCLTQELAAQILTGNLDPLPHYKDILRASSPASDASLPRVLVVDPRSPSGPDGPSDSLLSQLLDFSPNHGSPPDAGFLSSLTSRGSVLAFPESS